MEFNGKGVVGDAAVVSSIMAKIDKCLMVRLTVVRGGGPAPVNEAMYETISTSGGRGVAPAPYDAFIGAPPPSTRRKSSLPGSVEPYNGTMSTTGRTGSVRREDVADVITPGEYSRWRSCVHACMPCGALVVALSVCMPCGALAVALSACMPCGALVVALSACMHCGALFHG